MLTRNHEPMDDNARQSIALHRLAQVHQRCVEIAYSAEVEEQIAVNGQTGTPLLGSLQAVSNGASEKGDERSGQLTTLSRK